MAEEPPPPNPPDADNLEIPPEPHIDVFERPAPPGFEVTISQGPSPIPPATELERLAAIQADLPDRIMAMAERESEHRRQLEQRTLDAQIEDARNDRAEARIGQVIGAMVALLGLIVALIAAVYDAQWAASIIGGGTLASLATAFVRGRAARKAQDADQPGQ